MGQRTSPRVRSVLVFLALFSGTLAGNAAPAVAADPGLVLTLTAAPADNVTVGNEIAYFVSMKNVGSSTLTQVSLKSTRAPAGATYVNNSLTPTSTCQPLDAGGFTCSFPNLPPGGAYRVSLSFEAPSQPTDAMAYSVVASAKERTKDQNKAHTDTWSAHTSTNVVAEDTSSNEDSVTTWLPSTGGEVFTNQVISDTNPQSTHVTVPACKDSEQGDGEDDCSRGYTVAVRERNFDTDPPTGEPKDPCGTSGSCTSQITHVLVCPVADNNCSASEPYRFSEAALRVTLRFGYSELPPTTLLALQAGQDPLQVWHNQQLVNTCDGANSALNNESLPDAAEACRSKAEPNGLIFDVDGVPNPNGYAETDVDSRYNGGWRT
jgi:uncharacterized repeat protein (TIGR01451 family)